MTQRSALRDLRVVILCGGLGTRIRDASETLPKPMLPIGTMPIVWHVMKGFASFGLNSFVLSIGYKGRILKDFFINYQTTTSDLRVRLGKAGGVEVLGPTRDEDWEVVLADTGEATMTGGRISGVRRYVESDDVFLVTYGDGVGNVDIGALVDFHRSHGKIATVTAVRPPGRFGEMNLAGVSVRSFAEKPQAEDGWINGGFFVFDAQRIWDYLGDDKGCVLELEPMQKLVADGELAAYRHEDFWQPIDTLREFKLLNRLWDQDAPPWKTW